MDEEICSRAHLRSQSWSREHREGIAGGGHSRCCVLCWVWEHCSFHVVLKVGTNHWCSQGDRKSLVDFSSVTGQVTSMERNMYTGSHPSWIPSWLYFCILCIFLGGWAVRLSYFWMCNIRWQCLVQSCNTRMISLSQQAFFSNRAGFIHLKKVHLSIWKKVLPSHIFLNK